MDKLAFPLCNLLIDIDNYLLIQAILKKGSKVDVNINNKLLKRVPLHMIKE